MSIFNYIGLIKSEVGQKMGKKECLVGSISILLIPYHCGRRSYQTRSFPGGGGLPKMVNYKLRKKRLYQTSESYSGGGGCFRSNLATIF